MVDILSTNPMLLFGVAGAIGAGARGLIAYYKRKQNEKKTEFDISVYSDTIVQGVVTGIAAAATLPVSYAALGLTAVGSAGVDTYLNKFGIKIMPILKKIVVKEGSKKKRK